MTFEPFATDAALRAQAREQLDRLSTTVAQLAVGMDFDQRIELTSWLAEGRRLLFGPEAPPATKRPPLRVVVGIGFKRRSLLTSADCFAAGENLPPEGPEAA